MAKTIRAAIRHGWRGALIIPAEYFDEPAVVTNSWYLKFPASTGNGLTNNKLVQLSGIATSGPINVAVTFAENVVATAVNAYLFDGRRGLDVIFDSGPFSYLSRWTDSTVETSGTSNYKLNGVTTNKNTWVTALADQTYSFDALANPDGTVAIGARFNEVESYPLLAIKKIVITDINGAHTVDMSVSGGTSNQFNSTDGLVTLKLFGFTGSSHWVQYSAGNVTHTGGAAVSFAVNTVGGGRVRFIGGKSATFSVNNTGGGNIIRRGGNSLVINPLVAGGGAVNRRGGAVSSFSFNSVGGGTTRRRGGALLTFTLSMVGGGEVIEGSAVITGGAAITFSTSVTGGGVVLRRGGSALTSFSLNTVGGGSVRRRGGAAVSSVVNTVGSGNTVRRGGAVASSVINTAGSGGVNRKSGGVADFSVNIDGGGVIVFAGGGQIEFTVVTVGGGIALGQGYQPTFSAPVLMLNKKSSADSLAIGKKERVPYNLSVYNNSVSETLPVGDSFVAASLAVNKVFRGQQCIL